MNKSRLVIFCSLCLFFVIASNSTLKAQGITGPEQDCDNALPVCFTSFEQNDSYQLSGNVDDLEFVNSCLDNGETNSVWYIFTVSDPGDLKFSIIPKQSVDDYDFSLFDITGGSCADIAAGIANEVRCNYAFSSGQTGLADGYTGTAEGPGGLPFNAPLPVLAGQTYALVVDNFSSTNFGYSIDFGQSSASILDSTHPQIDSSITYRLPCSNTESLLITFTEPVLCSSIDPDGENFAISGPSAVTVDTVIAPDCQSGAFTLTATIYFSSPINVSGNYYLKPVADATGNNIEDNCGYPASENDSVLIEVPEIINANFSYTRASGCNVDTVNFINTSIGNYNNSLWDFGDGNTSTMENPIHVYAALDTYTVSLTISNAECSVTHIDSNVILSRTNNLDFFFTREDPCVNEPVNFFDVSTVTASQYYWDFGDGNVANVENPTHSYSMGGTYTIAFTKFDMVGDSCVDTLRKDIFIRENVNANFTFVPQASCVGDPLVFTDISTGSPTSRLWEFEDGFTATDSQFTYIFTSVGTDSVILTVRDSLCSNRDDTTMAVSTEAAPAFDLGPDQEICLDETVILTAASNAVSYLWSTGETTEMIEFGDVPGEVWAIAYLGNCDYSDTVFIDEKLEGCAAAIVPTAFSPNNDNINDLLKVVTLRVAEMELMIFNRWGEMVFETSDPDIGWDGNHKDEPQGIGTYTYILRWRAATSDTRRRTDSGTITLIR